MKVLLDTNAWIAFFEDHPSLSAAAADLIESETVELFVSVASIWEASIKTGLGKLSLPYDLATDLPGILEENGIEILPIAFYDATGVRDLQKIHGDPFDRIQVIQAQRLGMQIISRDATFDQYGVTRIW